MCIRDRFRRRTNKQSQPRILLPYPVSLELFFFDVFHVLIETPWRKFNSATVCFGAKDKQFDLVWSVSSWSWCLYPSCQTGSPIWTGDLWSSPSKCLKQMGLWSTLFRSSHTRLFDRRIQNHSPTGGSKFSLHHSGIWCAIQWNCLQRLPKSTPSVLR